MENSGTSRRHPTRTGRTAGGRSIAPLRGLASAPPAPTPLRGEAPPAGTTARRQSAIGSDAGLPDTTPAANSGSLRHRRVRAPRTSELAAGVSPVLPSSPSGAAFTRPRASAVVATATHDPEVAERDRRAKHARLAMAREPAPFSPIFGSRGACAVLPPSPAHEYGGMLSPTHLGPGAAAHKDPNTLARADLSMLAAGADIDRKPEARAAAVDAGPVAGAPGGHANRGVLGRKAQRAFVVRTDSPANLQRRVR